MASALDHPAGGVCPAVLERRHPCWRSCHVIVSSTNNQMGKARTRQKALSRKESAIVNDKIADLEVNEIRLVYYNNPEVPPLLWLARVLKTTGSKRPGLGRATADRRDINAIKPACQIMAQVAKGVFDVDRSQPFTTLAGQQYTIQPAGMSLYAVVDSTKKHVATITETIETSNGVLHIVDKLFPAPTVLPHVNTGDLLGLVSPSLSLSLSVRVRVVSPPSLALRLGVNSFVHSVLCRCCQRRLRHGRLREWQRHGRSCFTTLRGRHSWMSSRAPAL